MAREDLTWIGLVLVVLIGGLLLGQRLLDPQPNDGAPVGSTDFRQWLWQNRSLDLAVQVGLILTGALAIAALLPRSGESETGAASDRVRPDGGPQDKTQ